MAYNLSVYINITHFCQVSSGEIGPFSSVKLEIVWQPAIPGRTDTEFVLSFSDPLSSNVRICALKS